MLIRNSIHAPPQLMSIIILKVTSDNDNTAITTIITTTTTTILLLPVLKLYYWSKGSCQKWGVQWGNFIKITDDFFYSLCLRNTHIS